MAKIRPFRCLHPAEGYYNKIAALPYDVYSREEAAKAVENDSLSFLNIDRPETQFGKDQDMYADCVYEKADEMLKDWQKRGLLETEESPCYYIYSLTMDGREQNGIVACSSVDDYLDNVVKKHELTLEAKEQDRIRHVDRCNAQTGPIFLAYRKNAVLKEIIRKAKAKEALFDFVSADGIRHAGWKIEEEDSIRIITEEFEKMPATYIADGHHRCASAVKVALKRRKEHPDYKGNESFNYFLSVLFSEDELMILPYNRVIRDLNGLDQEGFLKKISEKYQIRKTNQPVSSSIKGETGMYLGGEWYLLREKEEYIIDDPVQSLDVAFLQREILTPVFGIENPRTDKRIAFVGGIRGTKELEKMCEKEFAAAFSMCPTSIQELFAVADADMLMPPKSTWFEPKLRSGLFIHKI